MTPPSIAAIILAAGASTRMGAPKQLLLYQGRSLLAHSAQTALAAGCRPVMVVLGHEAKRLQSELQTLPVQMVENPVWSQGMGTSIGRGVAALTAHPDPIDAAILMLCDQPLVTPDLLRQLIEVYRTGTKSIVACECSDSVGPPALFDRHLFPDLTVLTGPTGAKHVIQHHLAHTSLLTFPSAQLDIDTPSDYARLTPTPPAR